MHRCIITFLKKNPVILQICWKFAKVVLQFISLFIVKHPKQILFASFGGRSFNDSPRALYNEICKRDEFKDWDLVWAFVEPNKVKIPRGRKIKIDSLAFFLSLLQSKVWICNSSMDRSISLKIKGVVRVETWHGTPLKKIGGDEHQNTIGGKKYFQKKEMDVDTIRCAQSEYDQNLFQRIFHTTKECILLCDLPRNDNLLKYTSSEIDDIKKKIGIDKYRKVILYAPTFREYLWDENGNHLMVPPISLKKWEAFLSKDYILLFRAHYSVGTALNVIANDFVKDVSDYPELNDLYAISDIMISDYSSTFFDYSILDKPMFCFAYDLKEYQEKRGLYLDLQKTLPCKIHTDEDSLLLDILNTDIVKSSDATRIFHQKFAPYAGHACEKVVNEIIRRLK